MACIRMTTRFFASTSSCSNFVNFRIGENFLLNRSKIITTHRHFTFAQSSITLAKTCQAHQFDSRRSVSFASRLVSAAPVKWQPYLKLARLDAPIGTWLLLLPSLWSISLAAPIGELPSAQIIALFSIGALLMRGAGCTVNDLWDRDIDRKVTRTRDRPLASGQISRNQAVAFLCAQTGFGSLVLFQFDWFTIVFGVSSLLPVAIYPLCKRFTNWPQLVLGLTFNWGVWLGWSAATGGTICWSVCLPLYLAGVTWTLYYDTIYAHQDKTDDLLVGVKSTALALGDQTRAWLIGFGTMSGLALLMAGYQAEVSWPFYLGTGIAGAIVSHSIGTVNLDEPASCMKHFKRNRYVGFVVLIAILSNNAWCSL